MIGYDGDRLGCFGLYFSGSHLLQQIEDTFPVLGTTDTSYQYIMAVTNVDSKECAYMMTYQYGYSGGICDVQGRLMTDVIAAGKANEIRQYRFNPAPSGYADIKVKVVLTSKKWDTVSVRHEQSGNYKILYNAGSSVEMFAEKGDMLWFGTGKGDVSYDGFEGVEPTHVWNKDKYRHEFYINGECTIKVYNY